MVRKLSNWQYKDYVSILDTWPCMVLQKKHLRFWKNPNPYWRIIKGAVLDYSFEELKGSFYK